MGPAIKTFALLLALLAWCSISFADDLADAKAAFETLKSYQKSDDIRALDLFATNCLVTLTFIQGTNEHQVFVPPDAYREMLKKGIALKQGDNNSYEDVKCSRDGYMVKVTAMIHYADTGRRGPFMAIYGRDDDGILKIKELHVTTFVPKRPPKAATP